MGKKAIYCRAKLFSSVIIVVLYTYNSKFIILLLLQLFCNYYFFKECNHISVKWKFYIFVIFLTNGYIIVLFQVPKTKSRIMNQCLLCLNLKSIKHVKINKKGLHSMSFYAGSNFLIILSTKFVALQDYTYFLLKFIASILKSQCMKITIII